MLRAGIRVVCLCLLLMASASMSLAQRTGLDRPFTVTGQLLAGDPLDVQVGIQIDQITGINQKSENYGAVIVIGMQWSDPNLTRSW